MLSANGVTKLKIHSPLGREGFYVETIYSENISRISSNSLVPTTDTNRLLVQ